MTRLPLDGIRIADLSAVWAGPYATRLLADLGAEVIKVESPNNPDLLRALSLLPPGTENTWNKSAYFNHNNRNKLGVSLDLANPRGRELFLKLVEKCDAVIENYRAEVLDKLDLGYGVLKAAKPDIILVSMPGHGKDGPERDYVAYGTNVEQLAGLASLTGYRGGPPQKTGISYGDPVAGAAAAGALLLALLARRRTGRGQYVEVAQREALTGLIGEAVVGYSMTKEIPPRIGNRHPFWAPHGCFPSAGEDQWITIACRDDAEFVALCGVMEMPALATDARFAIAPARHAHQDDLETIIGGWTASLDRFEVFERLSAVGVPAMPVLTYVDLYENPHLRARGFFEQVTHREAGTWDMERQLYQFNRQSEHIRRSAPCFGEHNDYVFGELLGLSKDEVAALEKEGITATTPNMASHQ
jgi:crotonobetainyl-CoA:carnitine CoA-transferase CaiB-like acyl-CoA transferase